MATNTNTKTPCVEPRAFPSRLAYTGLIHAIRKGIFSNPATHTTPAIVSPPAHQHYHSTRAKAPREPRRVKLCRLEPLKGENFCRDLPKKKPARSAPPGLLSLSTHHSNALPIAPFHAHKHTHTHVRGKLAEEPFSKNASKPCHDQTETEISPVNVRGVQQVAAQCSGEQRSKRSRQVRRERAREVDRSLFSSWFVLGPAS